MAHVVDVDLDVDVNADADADGLYACLSFVSMETTRSSRDLPSSSSALETTPSASKALKDSLEDLDRVLRLLGPHWKVVFSDFKTDSGGNRERIGYLYDERAVTFTGLAAEAEPPRERTKISDDPVRYSYLSKIDWWRSPFMASFRAGTFDFVVLTAHIRSADRVSDRYAPLRALADWIEERRTEAFVTDKDVIVMGDFNITSRRSKTFKAITSRGLQVAPALLKKDLGTNLERDKRYDQILHCPMHKSLYLDKKGVYRVPGGVLDFYCKNHRALYPGRKDSLDRFKGEVSDHLPLWMQLNIWNSDIELDQILRG